MERVENLETVFSEQQQLLVSSLFQTRRSLRV